MAHFVKLENERENENIQNKKIKQQEKNKEEDEEFEECTICFEYVDTEKSFIGCDTCGKQCHAKCYMEWFLQKREKRGIKKCCISCQQPTLVYCEATTSIMSKCYTSIFGGKPKIKKKYYTVC